MTLQFSMTESAYFVWRRVNGSTRAYLGQVRASSPLAAACAALDRWPDAGRVLVREHKYGRTAAWL